MAKPFDELRERLLRAGAAPRHVRRYLSELADHLADLRAEEERAGRNPADAESAALIRLGGMDDLAKSMIEQRQFQAWSARAPWAIFGLAPLFLLAGVWFVSLLILWFGWQVFLPGAETPFGHHPGAHRIFDLANVYFQLDRLLYFAAPVLVGWAIGLLAARQRLKAVWPSVGFFLIALTGGMARVHASRTAVPHGLGHISMSFAFVPTIRGGPFGLLQMLLLPMIALPYLVWRFRKAHSLSA
jgi:hypothetical protein